MTQATQTRSTEPLQTNVQLHYEVAMPQPETHLFEVTLRISNWQADSLALKMPVWTPGSYLVREYARHVQNFSASQSNSQSTKPLTWRKCSKNHWQVDTAGAAEVTVRYRVFANELTVRTNHLDLTHGFFNGAALFFFVPGLEQQPIRVTIAPPHPDWQIATALPAVAGEPNTFEAIDFDTLVDSPFEVGIHQCYEFEAAGKSHTFAIWGQGNFERSAADVPDRLLADTEKIIQAEAELFGGLPYDRYLFLLHLSSQGFGGLEHKNCCTLLYSRFGFRNEERYQRFMQLVAHEFFHLWNVKRIRPKGLEVFDYEAENYTPSLWFSEGTTSYYDLTIPFRAGIYDAKTFLKLLSKEISQYLLIPGRKVQPLAESSFDAWIKLYRRDANSNNNQISYYLKGEMVSLLLDLLIRSRHQNQRSLDDVLRQLWQQFGRPEVGFTPEQLQTVIESVAGQELSDFFYQALQTTEELPFNEYLQAFGLEIQPEKLEGQPPYLGLIAKSENGREVVKAVEMDSPAQAAGIDPDDELLAIDGLRVKADQLGDRLKDYRPGDSVQLTLFHQDELHTRTVVLAEPRAIAYQVVPVAQLSAAQQQNLQGWLGIGAGATR